MFFWKKLPDESGLEVYQLRTKVSNIFYVILIILAILAIPIIDSGYLGITGLAVWIILLLIYLIAIFIGIQPVGYLTFMTKYSSKKLVKEGGMFDSNNPLTIKIQK